MFEVTTKIKVPFDVISDMLSMIDESVHYWGDVSYFDISDKDEQFVLYITDFEEETHTACEDDVNGALQFLANKYPQHFESIVNENWDVETVDVFVQALLFTEIIYG